MTGFSHDLRLAFRTLFKQSSYTAVVVLTLALGIGANTAIFSVVHGVLLKPLPYEESEDLVAVWGRFDPESGFDFPQFPLSVPEYVDYRRDSRAMEDVAAYRFGRMTVTSGKGDPERVAVAAVTANLFDVLRTAAVRGRMFSAEEDRPDSGSVVVLHHGYWQTRFGGDGDVVGQTIVVNSVSREVVGIMPPGFGYPSPEVRMWVPLGIDPDNPGNRKSHGTRAIGRLAPGATFEQAEAEMKTMMAAWETEFPDVHTAHYLFLRPLLEDVTGNVRPALLLLLAAAGFMLLIVCANVASVVLARGEGRLREVAIRTALGARRSRVVRLLLTESLLFSAVGGAAGLVLAHFGIRALRLLHAGSLPRAEALAIDTPVLLFAALITLVMAALFGLFPAFHAASKDLRSHLTEGSRGAGAGTGRLGFRRALVVVEVALSFLLVLGAGLMMKSFSKLTRVDPGFDSEQTLVTGVSLPGNDYQEDARVVDFYRQLLDRVRAFPGVRSAAASSALPLYDSPGVWDFDIQGKPEPGAGEMAWNASFSVVRPGFFTTLGIELRRGRLFSDADTADSLPVVVINEELVRRFFPGENALGQHIKVSGDDSPWMKVVGIVDDVRYVSLSDEARPAYYAVHDQAPLTAGYRFPAMHVMLRTVGDPITLTGSLRSLVKELDPNLPLSTVQTMEDVVHTSVARPRFTTVLLGLFATVALLLGGTGIYGVLTYSVVLRSQEIGIRKALGARPGQLAAMVIVQGMALVAGGLVIGGGASYAVMRVMSSLLFGVSLTDAATYSVVALVLGAVALLACCLPTLRAVRMDPLVVLRSE